MQKIIAFLKDNLLIWITLLLFCVLLYIYYFHGGFLVLGGEGNYWLDFKLYLENTGETWINYGAGMIGTSQNSIFSYPFLFSFIENIRLKSFILISFTYLMPFSTVYFLLRSFGKHTKIVAYFVALFFIINPFSVVFLNALNPWGIHILFIYPLLFLIIFRYFEDNIKLFIFFGITSVFFAYTLTNPPHMLLLIIFISIFALLAQIIKTNTLNLTTFIRKVILLYSSFALYNFWWIIHWVVVYPSVGQFYTFKFAKEWLSKVSVDSTLIFNDLFSFNWLTPKFTDYYFFSFFYNTPTITVVLFIPFAVILYWLIKERKTSTA